MPQLIVPARIAGGPPQVSLQLRASAPALRRAVIPSSKSGYANGNGRGHGSAIVTATAPAAAETFVAPEPWTEPAQASFDEGVGEPVAVETEETFLPEPSFNASAAFEENHQNFDSFASDFDSSVGEIIEAEPAPIAEEEVPALTFAQPEEEEFSAPEIEMPLEPITAEAVAEEPVAVAPAYASFEDEEPIGQGQPVPFLTPATVAEMAQPEIDPSAAVAGIGAGLAGIGALRHSVAPSSEAEADSDEPMAQQPTTISTMPQPTQPTPVIRTMPTSPASGAAPQQAGGAQPAAQPAPGGMHTAVQLTFSFEISSLQLTPSFKMGALQLKPTSKIVTMRLAPSQHPQPAMNLQVTFEIASVQLAGNSLGVIRLTPSQQQRPSISSSPSFNVAGLQLVAGSESAPVQITPSQQGQASVHVTGAFQIATVEFSPSFEIASIILNSTSRNVSVQLPGSGPSAVEGAPVFEITNVALGGNGEIGTMQLNPQGSGPKRA